MLKSNEKPLEKYQIKSITPVDDYVCTLSPEVKEILKNEFRETEDLRQFALESLREWTMQNARIKKTRLDSTWLLKYLRLTKFNIPATQEAIERQLVLRQGEWGQKTFHSDLDMTRPCIRAVLNLGSVCMLEGRDAEKRAILMFRAKDFPSEGPCLFQDMTTVTALAIEYLNEIEEFQARGVVYVIDCQYFNSSHLKLFPLDGIYKLVKNGEAMTAGRHKGFHFVNVHPIIAYPLRFAFDCGTAKWRDRFKIHKNFDTFDIVDRKYLPSEYGGEKSFMELAKEFEKKLAQRSELFVSYNSMRVDETCYPKAVMDGEAEMLKTPFNSPEFEKIKNNDMFGVHGSFRKLEID